MSSTGPALLAAAAGVGFGHAILPDHWVPLAVLGRARRYPMRRIARLSGLAGVAHVMVSLILGAVIIAVGLQFRSAVQSAQDAIVGGLLMATGVGFIALELSGRGHGHDHPSGGEHEHDHPSGGEHEHGAGHGAGHEHQHEPGVAHEHPAGHEHDHATGLAHRHEHRHGPELGTGRGLAAVMVPFGAAASPDLTILPVFLAATAAGFVTAIASLIIFAAVTIGTIVALTLAAARGSYEIQGQWLERWGNVITALVLLVIGGLVLTGTI